MSFRFIILIFLSSVTACGAITLTNDSITTYSNEQNVIIGKTKYDVTSNFIFSSSESNNGVFSVKKRVALNNITSNISKNSSKSHFFVHNLS